MPLSVWAHNRHHSRGLIYGDGDDDADERTKADTKYLLLVISHIGTDITDNTHATATHSDRTKKTTEESTSDEFSINCFLFRFGVIFAPFAHLL